MLEGELIEQLEDQLYSEEDDFLDYEERMLKLVPIECRTINKKALHPQHKVRCIKLPREYRPGSIPLSVRRYG